MAQQEDAFTYKAYGLGVHSKLELRELIPEAAPADLSVEMGTLQWRPETVDEQGRGFAATGDEAYYFFREAGTYRVRQGREIVVDPIAGGDPGVLRLSLLGPVMALALLQRGAFLLHASAAAVDGKAMVFLGGHAWGKSTLVAVLHSSGHRMLADDLTAVETNTGRPMVIPGFPQLKLWPDAVTALGRDRSSLRRLHPRIQKLGLSVKENFSSAPAPLRRIHVLAEGPSAEITPITPREALKTLLVHSYGARFGSGLFKVMEISSHFVQCASVVNAVPVSLLRRPLDHPVDPALVKLLEEDVRDF